jgi:ERCC4-type nuclease
LVFGDYQVNENLVFERKSFQDFEHSIKDGRLFKQASNLKENFKNPVIVLEGLPDYSKGNRFHLPRDTILGACLSVLEIGVPIVPTLSQADTARLIIRACKRQGKPPSSYRINTKKKAKNCMEYRRQFLEIFPSVGAKTAEKVASLDYSLIEIFKAICNNDDTLGLSRKQLKNSQEVLKKC